MYRPRRAWSHYPNDTVLAFEEATRSRHLADGDNMTGFFDITFVSNRGSRVECHGFPLSLDGILCILFLSTLGL
jgi:hypothetical protein